MLTNPLLIPFGPDIWISDGPALNVLGFHYPTRMAVIKLSNGGLFLWSPIAISQDLRSAIDALGPVHHIVAPNSLHHMALSDWQATYLDARFYAAPKLRAKRTDIAFNADLTDPSNPEWTGQIDQTIVHGNLITTEVVFFHRKSGTVLFTDLLQQFPDGWFTGWRGLIARLDLMTASEPAVPRKFRTAFINREAARTSVSRIQSWPAKKVVMAHGTPLTSDAPAFLRRAFSWLAK